MKIIALLISHSQSCNFFTYIIKEVVAIVSCTIQTRVDYFANFYFYFFRCQRHGSIDKE